MTQGKAFQMGTFHRPCCPELWHYLQPSLSSSTEREDLGLAAVFGHLTSPSLYKGMKCFSGFYLLNFPKNPGRWWSHKPCCSLLVFWLILACCNFCLLLLLSRSMNPIIPSPLQQSFPRWKPTIVLPLSPLVFRLICGLSIPWGLCLSNWPPQSCTGCAHWAGLVHEHGAASHWALWAILHHVKSRSPQAWMLLFNRFQVSMWRLDPCSPLSTARTRSWEASWNLILAIT